MRFFQASFSGYGLHHVSMLKPIDFESLARTLMSRLPETKPSMSDAITFDDCCRLILEQGAPPHNRPAPGQSDYRRDLLAVLNKEFGIKWNDTDGFQLSPTVRDAVGNSWNGGVPYIATSLVRHYGGIADPFSGILEYTFAKGEPDVWKAYQAGIRDAAMVMSQRFVAFFRDLLLLRWPKAAHRTTSWTRLRALGLDVPEDDPDDF